VLLSRPVGIGAAALMTAIFLGCMSLSFSVGNKYKPSDEGVLCQDGQSDLQPGATMEVYYPIAYAHPPNFQVSSVFDECVVVEQQADHFRVQNTDGKSTTTMFWKARGMKCSPVPAEPVQAVAVPEPAPTPNLPARPVPVPVSPSEHNP
jgi:hypothetical protein